MARLKYTQAQKNKIILQDHTFLITQKRIKAKQGKSSNLLKGHPKHKLATEWKVLKFFGETQETMHTQRQALLGISKNI